MVVPEGLVVEALYRYPVKSMQGEAMAEVRFDGGHVAGDRQLALVDAETGFTLSAKRHGALLEAYARTTDGGSVILTLPGGGELEAEDPATAEALSDWLGRPVEVRRPGGGGLPIELLTDALDEDSEVISFPVPEGHFADMADAHLITTASLAAARELHPDGDWDVRRFRPTAVLTGAERGFAEDDWVGSEVGLGAEVRLEVFMPTIRCSLPPRAQPGLKRDTALARALKDNHDFCLGVYAACRAEGVVRVGDAVTVAPSPG